MVYNENTWRELHSRVIILTELERPIGRRGNRSLIRDILDVSKWTSVSISAKVTLSRFGSQERSDS